LGTSPRASRLPQAVNFEQSEMRGRKCGQRAPLQDLVDGSQRTFAPLLFVACLGAFLCERGIGFEERGAKLV
jgi:hypothetical protein